MKEEKIRVLYADDEPTARLLIDPQVRDDTVVYPPVEQLRRAHFYSPLSPAGEDGHAASGRGSRTVFRHQRARNRQ